MTDTQTTDSEKVTEEDVLIQTPNGKRYPAAEINVTGEITSEE